MDDKKSHGAKNEGWNIMLKGGAMNHICSYDDPSIPTPHCEWLCKRWVKKLHIWNTARADCDWFKKSRVGEGQS